jgi:hypothetical protein
MGAPQRPSLGFSGGGSSSLEQDPLARGLQRVYDPSLERPGRGGRVPPRDPALRLAASPFNADMSDMRWGFSCLLCGIYCWPFKDRNTSIRLSSRMHMATGVCHMPAASLARMSHDACP